MNIAAKSWITESRCLGRHLTTKFQTYSINYQFIFCASSSGNLKLYGTRILQYVIREHRRLWQEHSPRFVNAKELRI